MKTFVQVAYKIKHSDSICLLLHRFQKSLKVVTLKAEKRAGERGGGDGAEDVKGCW